MTFSCIRSHANAVTGAKQAGTGHPRCFFGVILIFSRIRCHFNSVRVYLIACIRRFLGVPSNRSNFNIVSIYTNAGNRCLFIVIFILSSIRSHLFPFNLNTRNRCSFSIILIFSGIRSHVFPSISGQQLNYARICCFNVILNFSGIRSHFFPFTGGQQLNNSRFCCSVSVISNLSRIRPHLNSVDAYLNARIRCFFLCILQFFKDPAPIHLSYSLFFLRNFYYFILFYFIIIYLMFYFYYSI